MQARSLNRLGLLLLALALGWVTILILAHVRLEDPAAPARAIAEHWLQIAAAEGLSYLALALLAAARLKKASGTIADNRAGERAWE